MKENYIFIGGPSDGTVCGVDSDATFVRVSERPSPIVVPMDQESVLSVSSQFYTYEKCNLGSRAEPLFVFALHGLKHQDIMKHLLRWYPLWR